MLPLLNMKIILFTQFDKKNGWEVPLLILLGLSLSEKHLETQNLATDCLTIKMLLKCNLSAAIADKLGWDFHEQI